MSWTKKCAMAVMAICAISYACAPARATLWSIQSAQSKVSLSIPDQVVDGNKIGVRNQTGSGSNWTVGNSASLSGTFVTSTTFNSQGTKIDFVPGGSIIGLNTGNYRPNPAAFNPAATSTINTDGSYSNTSTTPGVFGAKAVAVDVLGAAVAYLAFRNVNFGLDSAVIPLSGSGFTQTFNATGVQFGITSASLDVDGVSVIIVGQLIPDIVNASLTNVFGSNTSPNGTVTRNGFELSTMTIPLSIPISIDLDGTLLTANLTGQIVAVTVPEPSTLMMAGIGLLSLVECVRQRRK